MKKFSLYLGGVALLFLILILLLPNSASAKEGECHLEWCLVPSPTILGPESGETVNSLRPGIKGLTWKTTIVKVYLDGQELTGVKQIKHEDYYGSFFVRPNFDLKPGRHYIYTIAHSENPSLYDQSKESIYIYFNVTGPKAAQAQAVELPASPPAAPTRQRGEERERGEPAMPEEKVSQAQEPTVEIIAPEEKSEITVQEGKIEGGVSVVADSLPGLEDLNQKSESQETSLQKAANFEEIGEVLENELLAQKVLAKERRNRLIGLSMLGLIILIVIIWAAASRFSIKREFLKKEEGELPPPPVPPLGSARGESVSPLSMKQESLAYRQASKEAMKQDIGTLSVKNEEIIVEPIQEEDDLLPLAPDGATDDYWASPPPSPYSPYPSVEEEMKSEQDKLI